MKASTIRASFLWLVVAALPAAVVRSQVDSDPPSIAPSLVGVVPAPVAPAPPTAPTVQCGGGCQNGGQCSQNPNNSYSCDCSAAYDGSTAYAGLRCEYPSTSQCEQGVSASTYAFCVNQGTCIASVQTGAEFLGCDCPASVVGAHCEYLETEVAPSSAPTQSALTPSLPPIVATSTTTFTPTTSTSSSTGTPSVGTPGTTAPTATPVVQSSPSPVAGQSDLPSLVPSDIPSLVPSDIPSLVPSIVPSGFSMPTAPTVPVTGRPVMTIEESPSRQLVCPGSTFSCYNGGTCVKNPNNSYQCNCTAAYDGFTAFAGFQCEYTSTVNCESGVTQSTYAFCVNQGICNTVVAKGQPHQGCQCPAAVGGPHCEYMDSAAVPSAAPSESRVLQSGATLPVCLRWAAWILMMIPILQNIV